MSHGSRKSCQDFPSINSTAYLCTQSTQPQRKRRYNRNGRFLRTPERTPVFGLLRRQVYVKEGGDLLYGRLIYGRVVDLMDSLAER